MGLFDFLKKDESIKTTEEHLEYFNNIRKKNTDELEIKHKEFLKDSLIPDEFAKYVLFEDSYGTQSIYMRIPFLRFPLRVTKHRKDTFVFYYYDNPFASEYEDNCHDFNSFESFMKYAIGIKEVKVKK
jgi:hypothetical protein